MKLYVGNLSFDTTENDLQDAFEQFGTVSDVRLMLDHGTGRSRGFGFVTMSTAAEGQAAANSLNGKPLGGRNLTVNEARPREDRPAGGRGNDRGGNDRPPQRSFSNSRR